MVSEILQAKFYTTLDRMKDGSNDNLIESIKEGAKTIFEGFKSDYARPTSADTYKATPDDLTDLTGTSMYVDEPKGKLNDEDAVYIEPEETVKKEYGDDVDIFDIFNDNDDVSHAYDDLDYSAVAESVEYKKALSEMKDGKNDALIEALIDGLDEVSKEAEPATESRWEPNKDKRLFCDRLMKEFEPFVSPLGMSMEGFSKFMDGKQVYGFYVTNQDEDNKLVVVVYDGDIEGCYDVRYAPEMDFMYGNINHWFADSIFEDEGNIGKHLFMKTKNILTQPV